MKLHDHVREWALGYIREGKYSPVGVWFHWIMAALVLFPLLYVLSGPAWWLWTRMRRKPAA